MRRHLQHKLRFTPKLTLVVFLNHSHKEFKRGVIKFKLPWEVINDFTCRLLPHNEKFFISSSLIKSKKSRIWNAGDINLTSKIKMVLSKHRDCNSVDQWRNPNLECYWEKYTSVPTTKFSMSHLLCNSDMRTY